MWPWVLMKWTALAAAEIQRGEESQFELLRSTYLGRPCDLQTAKEPAPAEAPTGGCSQKKRRRKAQSTKSWQRHHNFSVAHQVRRMMGRNCVNGGWANHHEFKGQKAKKAASGGRRGTDAV